jgi:DNA-binding Lrp family transcriptional regulator
MAFPPVICAQIEHIAPQSRQMREFFRFCHGTCIICALSFRKPQEMRMRLDEIDCRLLAALQDDAQQTAQELGERLSLSASQAGRRRQRLEAEGFITGYAARLDPTKLGLGVQAFVQVQMATHAPDGARSFQRLLQTRTEIISAWTLTGEADYLLRVVCTDLKALNRVIHDVLLPHSAVARVQSQIVMNQFKADAPLPT